MNTATPSLRLSLVITTLGLLQAQVPTATAQEVARPAYSFLRQDENWEAFGRDGNHDDPLDGFKYISLSDDGIWVSFGGHARARYESWNNFNFGLMPAAGHDDGFLLTRLLVHADLHLGASDRVFVEGKTAQSTDRDLPGGTRTLDVDSLDVQQAFWDHTTPLSGGHATLRLGRQMLQLGNQRLVSPLPWGNTLRTWDGVSVLWDGPSWDLHAFWTRFAPVDIGDFNESKDGPDFYGAYATRKGSSLPDVDVYFLGFERDAAAFNGTAGEETRYTFGVRLNDKLDESHLDYDVEAAYQIGEVGSGDVGAYMFGGTVGYRFEGTELNPRVRFGLDLASGDHGTGGDVGTFNQLFPLGHAYLGFMDMVGRQNIFDLSLGADFDLGPGWKGRIDLHSFRLLAEEDALYNAGGGVVVPGGTSSSKDVGAELDITTTYKVDRHLVLSAGLGRLFAGETIDDAALVTGSGGDDIDFAYLGAIYTF